jgi:predicted cobalt transporter CbtA
MRPEFKVALDAWLATEPLTNPDAEPTPFTMAEYRQEAAELADERLEEADEHRQAALDANQNGDNYVLTTVGFALVIFFAGVSSKLSEKRNREIALGVAVFLFVFGLVALGLLPVVPPF